MAEEKARNYNKSELVRAIAERTGKTQKDVFDVLDAFMAITKEEVAKDATVRLLGFGTFRKAHRDAHPGRNPRTGEAITVPASDALAFRSMVKY